MNGTGTASQQTGTKLIDDFLRRELRVGDPKNAAEVATALRTRYTTDAARIDQEQSGYALAFTTSVAPGLPSGPRPGTWETDIATTLENDLETLISEPGNRERRLELKGWRETCLDEWEGGLAAAFHAQDPAERDRTFHAIWKLSDFARVSRLAAVAYPEIFFPYRRVATTLDACGNVLRVRMGQALYDAGLAEGGLIVPMPLADARDRRDGLIQSVRRLTGTAPEDGDWPDGLVSYRALRDAIQTERRPDLAIYLREEGLAPILDTLLADANRLSPEALRELAVASLIDVTRLGELLALINRSAIPPSPPLATLVENLRLMLQFFGVVVGGPIQNRLGARLIEVAVPVPLATLGPNVADALPRQQLRSLVSWRHAFAAAAEVAFPTPIGAADAADQIQIDIALFALDRAIDYFAQGGGGDQQPPAPQIWGEEEERAGVYLQMVQNLLAGVVAAGAPANIVALNPAFAAIFAAGPPAPPAATQNEIEEELVRSMLTWMAMVRSLSPR